MITIGIDTGIATMGIAAADENGRVLFAHFCGTTKGQGSVTDDLDVRVRAQAKSIYAVIKKARDWSQDLDYDLVRIVKEERSTNGKFSANSKMQQSAAAAMIATLATLEDIPLISVAAESWQRRMLGIAPKEKIDYEAVTSTIVAHVERSKASSYLNWINDSQRNHAIDACGIAVYGALYWNEIVAQRAEIKSTKPKKRKPRKATQ